MDSEERRLAGLTFRVDRLLCVGFETCVDLAPELFLLDEEGIATFADAADSVPAACVLEACRSCPVDALQVLDAAGNQVVP